LYRPGRGIIWDEFLPTVFVAELVDSFPTQNISHAIGHDQTRVNAKNPHAFLNAPTS
jgi:hypothetical protein